MNAAADVEMLAGEAYEVQQQQQQVPKQQQHGSSSSMVLIIICIIYSICICECCC